MACSTSKRTQTIHRWRTSPSTKRTLLLKHQFPSLHPLTPPSTGLSNPIMDPLPPVRMQNLLQTLPKSPSEHRPHRDATSSPTKSQQPTRIRMASLPRPPISHRQFPLFAKQQRRRPPRVADHRAHEPGCV